MKNGYEVTLKDIREAKEDVAAKKAVDALSAFVNCSHDAKHFNILMGIEHRTLQQSMTRLMISWLRYLAMMGENGQTDLRNEAAAKAARIMIDAFDEKHIGLPFI